MLQYTVLQCTAHYNFVHTKLYVRLDQGCLTKFMLLSKFAWPREMDYTPGENGWSVETLQLLLAPVLCPDPWLLRVRLQYVRLSCGNAPSLAVRDVSDGNGKG